MKAFKLMSDKELVQALRYEDDRRKRKLIAHPEKERDIALHHLTLKFIALKQHDKL